VAPELLPAAACLSTGMYERILLGWLGIAGLWTFLLFGYDKWQAGRSGGRRIAESSLLLASALGGWPGGLLGLVVFRHKSAKHAFQLKFAGAFVVWAALVAGALRLTGRI
jgi:uncharacterized membrane protein YsdA (DUF1294 family)